MKPPWNRRLLYLLSFFFVLQSPNVSAQFKLSDIPVLGKDDFQAPVPKRSEFWINISSVIYYRIDSVAQEGDQFRVWIKTKVEMQKHLSFWNHKKVKPKYEAQLLLHEQGHFYMSHIVANRLEKLMPGFVFSENYQQEVREKYNELQGKLYHQFSNYEKDTKHGMDVEKQKEWTGWLRRQFM